MGDHPRACGEKAGIRAVGLGRWGSPPRMQGKVKCFLKNLPSKRITPACAGKSADGQIASAGNWDHPRACGEKLPDGKCTLYPQGSPPRMRGKGLNILLVLLILRITPAHAGKRKRQADRLQEGQDHPRACGEKCPSLRERRHWHRITPAHAGKSVFRPDVLFPFGDHPRVCGEKTVTDLSRLVEQGSPPRVRGKACMTTSKLPYPGDHPRVCGEK